MERTSQTHRDRSNDKKILENRDFYRIERDAQPEATGIVLAIPTVGQSAVESLGERSDRRCKCETGLRAEGAAAAEGFAHREPDVKGS